MTRFLFAAAFVLGSAAILWVATGFIGSDALALTVTVVIGMVYAIGCLEMLQYRRATATLAGALQPQSISIESLDGWLRQLHPSLQNTVRMRIEGERIALPGPVFTPYLVGLLVMLGLLGTFIGMVVTLNGAVLALQGTTELETMRQGLATPIKGLGLAFGTSVAGVAASAMLGLISTVSRRERMQVGGLLEQRIANEFRQFSLTHHRQETFKAIQYQAQALPQVAERLQAMADQMEAMTHTMTTAISDSQEKFQQTASRSFSDLASAVSESLKLNLEQTGRLAGDSIQPLVESTMASLEQQAKHTQEQMQANMADQLQQLSSGFAQTVAAVSSSWQSGVQQYEQQQRQLVERVDHVFENIGNQFASSADQLVSGLEQKNELLLQRLGEGDEQRLSQWGNTLGKVSEEMIGGWQAFSEQQQAQQRKLLDSIGEQVASVAQTAAGTSTELLSEWQQVLTQSSDLVQERMQHEQVWLEQQQQRIAEVADTLGAELTRLRDDEAQRGAAAQQRLGQLESTVATHLNQLGTALEAPMARLIETASAAPKAAAEVLEQLRQEISNNIERDNELLQERQQLMNGLSSLLASLQESSAQQRAAIESLVSDSTQNLVEIGERFSQQVAGETDKLVGMADNLEAGALEVSSLGEAFNHAVELFSESNAKLIDNLNRVEAALEKSSNRSDEQLAYYVAQAREVIDLSMMSQKEIIEELRHKADQPVPSQSASASREQVETDTVAEEVS